MPGDHAIAASPRAYTKKVSDPYRSRPCHSTHTDYQVCHTASAFERGSPFVVHSGRKSYRRIEQRLLASCRMETKHFLMLDTDVHIRQCKP